MARQYSRNGRGQFAGKSAKGGVATTTQQDRAEHKRTLRDDKKALSGGKLGGGRAKRVNRNKTVGKAATNKRLKAALANARRRFT